jgi:hypothetical protein
MGEWTQTTCDHCNYEGYNGYGRQGYFEGSAGLACFEGWAVLERKRMTTPMTLSDGYVLPARETVDRLVLCVECLKDRETVDNYIGWDGSGYDAENYRKARKAFDEADEAEWERESAASEAAVASREEDAQ